MTSFFKNLFLTLSALSVLVFFSNTSFANEVNIGVSPLIIELKANPGETVSEKVKINVGKNNQGTSLATRVRDFYYDENDELQFLTPEEEEDPDLKQFALKSWLSVDQDITFDNNGERDVPISVKVPKDATPGGRYGMVLFSKSSGPAKGEGSNVGVGGQVGVMILVTVNGEYSSGGSISEKLKSGSLSKDGRTFDAHKIFSGGSLFKNGPIDFKFRFLNNSATHVVPKGSITVRNIFGGLVEKFDIQGKRVFPGVSRSLYGTLNKNFLFGIYKADLELTDGDGNVHSSGTFFIGFPLKLVVLILLFFGAIFMFFKYYNKWLINKALKQYGKSTKNKKI